jgi:hypothetical protein
MATVLITQDCTEFGMSLSAGQTVWLSELHALAMWQSGLAEYKLGGAVRLPETGQIVVPITSVQAGDPVAFGLTANNGLTYAFHGWRYYGDGTRFRSL